MITREELGVALMMLRKRRGLTMKQLAEQSHVSESTISSYEHGTTSPSVESLQMILEPLGYMIDIRRDIDE